MAKQLTDRQKQIKRLLDQNKTPREVAKALGITENAVYQMRRRMKPTTANGTKPARAPARKPAARKPTTARATTAPARKRATRQPFQALLPGTLKAISPLEAIAQRRSTIEAQLRATGSALDAAIKVQESAEKTHAAALAKVHPELEALKTAEAVLTGKIRTVPARKATTSRSNAKTKTPSAAPPSAYGAPPETVGGATADADELELAKAQAEAARPPAPVEHEVSEPSPVIPNEEERPGVPTLAEFEQPEVEFVE